MSRPQRPESPKIMWARNVCLSFPHVTEEVQWGNDLVFKVQGKMFCVLALDPAEVAISFKTSEAKFEELIQQPGIIPAPYLARVHWVALQDPEAVTPQELSEMLRHSYDLVCSRLPLKVRQRLGMMTPDR